MNTTTMELNGKVYGLAGADACADEAALGASLDAGGWKSWVCLTPVCPSFLEAALVKRGISYAHLSIEAPTTCTIETARAAHKLLSELPGPCMVQCATANRASAALAIHHSLSSGLTSQEAFKWATDNNLKMAASAPMRAWLQLAVAPAPAHSLLGPGAAHRVILRQLFEKASSTYTYLLACPETMEGVLIDPVLETAGRDVELANALGVRLVAALNTHVHADHVSGTATLKAKVKGLQSVVSAVSGATCDRAVGEGDVIHFGRRHLRVLSTPGHTDGCLSYVLDDASMAFTGDALLVRGCGRTDFQQGSTKKLWESVHGKILGGGAGLPDSCVLYPGHDYVGHTSTTVAEERAFNPRLGMGRTFEEFDAIMGSLGLPRPAQIDKAVPANMLDGVVVVEAAPAAPAAAALEPQALMTAKA